MLFKRLYNWIKYKTLPTSFLFKNRLFIERDSKHRRVMSNFGLSFRNSKWSNYETYNIKLQFKRNYLHFLFLIILFFLILFFLIYFKKYYIFSFFFNNVSFLFWISIDTFDYYFTFIVWLVFISISLFFKLIYSYFFYNNFFTNKSSKDMFSYKPFHYFNFSINSFYSSNNIFISKNDLNWLMYSWLVNSKSEKKNHIIENLFENKIHRQWWNVYHDFFIKLYKLSYFLNLSSTNFNIFSLNLNLKKISNKYYKGSYLNFTNFFNNSFLLNNNFSLISYYILNNYNNYFILKNKKTNSLTHLKNRSSWNLFNLNQELNNYPYLIKNKSGMFFLDDFNYQKFSHYVFNYEELWSLNLYFKNQLNSSKWNRWLYRYSILHRKSLKNSYKITLSKKLINSGFYDSKLFNKNIWASEHLSYLNSKNNFNSLFFNFYKNLFNLDENQSNSNYNFFILNNGSQKNSLNLFNFYENSYFWYLKRFYLLNNLSSNFIKSKLNLNISKNLNNFENNFKYFTILSYFLNSSYSNLSIYSHFSDNSIQFLNFYNTFDSISLNNFKDIYLLINENDLLNKDNLNFLYWITSNSSKKNNLVFFNYLNFLQNLNQTPFSLFYKNNNDLLNLNFWMLYSLLTMDKFYINDIVYLSLFN